MLARGVAGAYRSLIRKHHEVKAPAEWVCSVCERDFHDIAVVAKFFNTVLKSFCDRAVIVGNFTHHKYMEKAQLDQVMNMYEDRDAAPACVCAERA